MSEQLDVLRSYVRRTSVRQSSAFERCRQPEADIFRTCVPYGCLTWADAIRTLLAMAPPISTRQRSILEYIEQQIRERGYPPSVRELHHCAPREQYAYKIK